MPENPPTPTDQALEDIAAEALLQRFPGDARTPDIGTALRLAWAAGYRQAATGTAPAGDRVAANDACPACGEGDPDRLVWTDDEAVRCATCGTTYEPQASSTGGPPADALAVCEALSRYAHDLYEDIPGDLASIVADARVVLGQGKE